MPQVYATDAYLLSLFPQFLVLQRAQWRVTVLSATPDIEYSIEASTDPTPYADTAANGETLTSLRNKLRAAVNGSSLVVTAASSLAVELLVSEVVAGTVALSVGPEGGLAVELITPADKHAALRAAWLADTKSEVGLCAWGEKASRGHALLAAHNIALAIGADPNTGLSVTDIESMRLGPAEVKLGGAAKASKSADPLAATSFGRQYLQLRATLPLTPIADIGSWCC